MIEKFLKEKDSFNDFEAEEKFKEAWNCAKERV